ncbi:MAG TPA: hypothetical protein VEX68_29980 [Bryobacteraceae bacterium]|nr:hypothetical protein [Bryobacteraceae bacterium]
MLAGPTVNLSFISEASIVAWESKKKLPAQGIFIRLLQGNTLGEMVLASLVDNLVRV